MRTAIDSSVLFSVLKGEADARDWVDRLVEERKMSQLIVCDVVYAETATLFEDATELDEALAPLGVRFDPIGAAAAHRAGQVFRKYRRAGGPREHLIPDFLIGAHASVQALALVAKDRGYLRRYFPSLRVLSLE